MTSKPKYDRQSHFLQFGERWFVNTEVQILLHDGTSEWFTPEVWQNVLKILSSPFEERFQSKEESKNFDTIGNDNMLIIYRFHRHGKNHKRDTYLTRVPKEVIKPGAARESYGKFKPCYLRNERLTITVSKTCSSKELDQNELNVSEPVISSYFKKTSTKKIDAESVKDEKIRIVLDTDVSEPLVTHEKCNVISVADDDESFHTKVTKFQRTKQQCLDVDKNNIVREKCKKSTDKNEAETSKKQADKVQTKENIVQRERKKQTDKKSCSRKETDKVQSKDRRKKKSSVKTQPKTDEDKEDENPELFDTIEKDNITKVKSKEVKNKKKSATVKPQRGRDTNKNKKMDESILELAGEHLNVPSNTSETSTTKKAPSMKSPMVIIEESDMPSDMKSPFNVEESNVVSSVPEDSDSDEFLETPVFNTKGKRRKRKQKITLPAKKKKKESSSGKQRKASNSSAGSHFSLEELVKNKENEHSEVIEESIATPGSQTLDDTIDIEEYGKVSLEHVSGIAELTTIQIRDIVRSLDNDLRAIFEGKVYCERHERYKKGGKERDCLNMQISLGQFSEEQEDMITKVLREIFCKRKTTYFDYVIKVLLPEALLMVYQKVSGCSTEEAIRAFSN